MGHCVIFSGKQGAAPPSRIVPVRLCLNPFSSFFLHFPKHRMMREHTSTPRFNRPLIPNQKLEEHFSTHFSDRKYEPQPELEQPESYPHVLPPDDVPAIDDSVPERGEVESSIKKLKNGKCQGTDKIYAQQLKYSRSSGLFNYMALLIALIWSCAQVPGKWLTASITCLHKK